MPPSALKTKPPTADKRDAARRAKSSIAPIEIPVSIDPGNAVTSVGFGVSRDDIVSFPSAYFSMPASGLDTESRSPRTYGMDDEKVGATMLIGDEIVYTGQSAIDAGGDLTRWTGSDPSANKPAFSRAFLLAGIVARHPFARQIRATVYANVHESALIEPTRQNLMGMHLIEVLDSSIDGGVTRRKVEIEIQVEKVLLEECGAIVNAAHISHDGGVTPLVNAGTPVAVIGIGGRTTNVAKFKGSKTLLAPQAANVGGFKLIQEICRQDTLAKRIRQRNYDLVGGPSFDLVKQGIESGEFAYGYTGVSFRPEFDVLVDRILIRPALEHAKPLIDTSGVSAILLTGGCSLMPGVADAARRSLPAVVTTGMGDVDNALGLWRLANRALDRRLGK